MEPLNWMDAAPVTPNLLPWIALLGLGALHGINPAMGWLFAVGRGLQEERRGAVWQALGPLALGHLLAVTAALLAAAVLGLVVPSRWLGWLVAAALITMGMTQLRRHRHPRYGGMCMSSRELTVWSFLMASAHGAGLMALPFVLGAVGGGAPGGGEGAGLTGGSAGIMAAGGHAHHAAEAALQASLPFEQLAGLLATVLHTVGYLAVTGLVAVIVYEKLGLRLLRSAWINLELIWAVALIATGALSLVMLG